MNGHNANTSNHENHENHDVGDPAFEDRVRGLLEGDGASRGVSVTSVIAGAGRRRVRRRATAAGSSVAVLGVAAGVVAFGMHSAAGPEATGTVTSTVGTTVAPTTATATESTAAAAQTCSPSVTGSVPATTPATAEGLDFETVSGTTAGTPWSVQIHAFPTWQSYMDWRKTQTDPPVPSTASHVLGPPALFRPSGRSEFTMTSIPHYFFAFAGEGLAAPARSPKQYLVEGWTVPAIDHLCLQFAHHAEFEPVYRIQGGAFTVFGYTAADEPQSVTGYDASGHVVSKANGTNGLLPPDGR